MSVSKCLTFVDVFTGCGGLSLGLFQAGWKGLFAIEADRFAFETLKHNLIVGGSFTYDWPKWLPKEPRNISGFIEEYKKQLEPMVGQVDLVVGGPPCQGFSLAGRRDKNDPRNRLFKHYLELVDFLQSPLLFFENVRGVTIVHGKKHQPRRRRPGRPPIPFSAKIQKKLGQMGYTVFPRFIRAVDFGVPQIRPRYIMIAVKKELLVNRPGYDPYSNLVDLQKNFCQTRACQRMSLSASARLSPTLKLLARTCSMRRRSRL